MNPSFVHARTHGDIRDYPNAERVRMYRAQLPKLPDYDALEHNRRVVHGATWQAKFRTRSIPKHRALVVYRPQC